MQAVPDHKREQRVQDEKEGQGHVSNVRPRGLELRPDHDALLLVRSTRAIVVSELKSLRSLGESRRSMIAVTSKVNGELWNTAKKARAGKTAKIHAR